MKPPAALKSAASHFIDQLCQTEEEPTGRVVTEVLVNIYGHLPPHYWAEVPLENRGLTVPFYEAVDNCGEAIVDAVLPICFDKELVESGQLYELRKKLLENEAHSFGLSMYERRKKAIPAPNERDEPPHELVEMYFKGTPFLDLFRTPVPLVIERARFNEHGFLFARSGHGKTQALRAIVASFLQEKDPPALFLIDSLGALIEGIEDLEVFNTTLKNRLVILDPSRPQYMPSLNFFGIKSDDMLFYLFKAIEQSFTQRQATLVSYLMEYMRALPNPSLLKLIEVCQSKTVDDKVLTKLSPFAQAFFQTQFSGKGDKYVQDTKSQIAQRLFTLGRLSKFSDIFDNTTSTFDPFACMQEKKIVLVNTDARPTDEGGLGEASSIFGRYILAQCLSAARRRPKDQRHLVLIVCDEAKAYLDDQSALILSDARQYGMGMLLASQQPHQLPEGVRREVNTNTSIRFMGQIEYAIASQYARDMRTTPDFILSMQKRDRSHADWAIHISGMERAAKVRVPYGVLETMPKRPKLSDEQLFEQFTTAIIVEAKEKAGQHKGQAEKPITKETMERFAKRAEEHGEEDVQAMIKATDEVDAERASPEDDPKPSSFEIKPGKKTW